MTKEERQKERKELIDILNAAIRYRAAMFRRKSSSNEEKAFADTAQRKAYENLNKHDGEMFESAKTNYPPVQSKVVNEMVTPIG